MIALLMALLVGAIAAALVALTTTETLDQRQLSPRAGGIVRRRGRARAGAPRPCRRCRTGRPPCGATSQRHIELRRWGGGAARARWPDARPRAADSRAPARERRSATVRPSSGPTARGGGSSRTPPCARSCSPEAAPGSTCRSTSWSGLQTTSPMATAIRRSTATARILVCAVAFGAGGARRSVEARVARTDDGDLGCWRGE